MVKKYLKEALLYALGIVLIGFIFQILSWIKNNDFFLPNVFDILGAFFLELGESKTWIGILNTILNVVLTILMSFIIGTIFAVFAFKFDIVYKILKPLMMLFRFIPIVIIIDLLFYMLYKEYNLMLYISVCSFLVPMIYEALYQGIKSIDKSYIDVYKLHSSFNLKILFRVYFPLSLGACKSAFLNAIGIGIKICLSVEFMCSLRNTLGYLIKYEIGAMDGYTRLYGYIIILILVSIILELIPLLIGFIYKKYKYRERKIELKYEESVLNN